MIGLFEDRSRRRNFMRTMATSNSNKEVDMKLLTFTAALLACYLLASTARAADKLLEELLVVRAQPAIL
jgi:hypothetical protein